MELNPFTVIVQKLDRIELRLERLENKKDENIQKPPEQLPPIGGLELAELITGLKRSTIYKLTAQGKLPCEKPGGKLRFLTADLLAWVKRNSNYD